MAQPENGAGKTLQPWETLDRRLIVDADPWLRLWVERVRLPDGRLVADYYAVEQPDYVVVMALTDDHRVIGIYHYKHAAKRINLGLPAGYVRRGEPPLAAAQRELREETGYHADHWRPLGSFVCDGNRGCGHAHIYLASGLRKVAAPAPDDLEEISLVLMSQEELRHHLRSGAVATLGAAAAIAVGLDALRSPGPMEVEDV